MSPHPYDGSYDLTNPQSLNRYSYVNNNPFSATDPGGLFAKIGSTVSRVDGTDLNLAHDG